jgi:hypothetical protein
MCCCHNRSSKTGDRGPETGARSPSSVLRLLSFRDDRGAAAVEGVLVFAMLAGVLLGVMLLGQWGTRLQYSQMGARLLTFDAGDDSLAKFGRLWDQASVTVSRDSVTWDTYFGSLPVDWFNTLFILHNDRYSSSVKGTQQGRLPSRGPNLFEFSRASLGYGSGASAASNPWADTTSDVQLTFLRIAYWVGYNESTPEGLSFIPDIPESGLPLLESIYTRLGVR